MKSTAQLTFLALLFMFCSCSGVKRVIIGIWSIDKVEYKNNDLFYDILSNIIIFKREKCVLPTFYKHHKVQSKEEGKWEVKKVGDQYFVTIRTENEIFAGTHMICFKKDYEKKLIKMIITSEDLFVECRKGLFNFDEDNGIVDDYLCIDENKTKER